MDRDVFSERTDIDIAIEGIESAEKMFKLYGDIMEITEFPIDIIQMEKIEPEFAELIKIKGKINSSKEYFSNRLFLYATRFATVYFYRQQVVLVLHHKSQ